MKDFFYWYRAFRRLILKKDSYLYSSGWIKSLRTGRPCDLDGTPVPWMNYSIINFLRERLNKNISMFEYGSGYSTLFYSNLVKDVTSVEYDEVWFKKISIDSPNNSTILYRPLASLETYRNSILEKNKKYHVVVIDGRDRVNCAKQAFNCLLDDGVIVFDDTWREKYVTIISYASELGYKYLNFEGIKPGGSKNHKTTLFYKENNCLGL